MLITIAVAGLLGPGLPEISPAPTASEDASFAIRAAHVHVGGGEVLEDATVWIEGGRIREVGAEVELPEGAQVVEHDGHLSAGLIALHDYSGMAGENVDSTRQLLPEAQLAYAFQPEHSDFGRLAQEGITSVVLAPAPTAVAGGVTAVVKVAGGTVLNPRAHLHLSFSSTSLRRDRYPTSYAGAIDELDARFAEPKGVFAEAREGKLRVLLDARDKDEVLRAVEFAKRHELKGAVSGASRAGEIASELKSSGLAVIYRPYSTGMERRSLRSVRALAEAGVPFGFALDAPQRHPAGLRLAAAACVREGLDAGVALRALTEVAARIAGVGDRVGRVAAGLDADLVLWSGDPIDLSSSVVAVYVDGERVHGGDE